ncbi:MAG: hypothetical protein ACNA77_06400 [Opitutales bacterium]
MQTPNTPWLSSPTHRQRSRLSRLRIRSSVATVLLGLLTFTMAGATPALPSNGLILNLDAEQIQGLGHGMPLVGGWPDASNSNSLFSSPNPPTFLADSGDDHPAVRFDGAGQYLEGLFAPGSEATVFVVYANRRTPLLPAYEETLLSSVDESGTASGIRLASTRLVDEGYVIQFGWDRDSFSRPAYRDQIGADEIVQWNGLDFLGGDSFDNGSLNNEPVGATLSSTQGGLTLISEVISSSDPLVSHTRQSGSQLGISQPGGATGFREELESSWSFRFNQEVELRQLLMSGLNSVNDLARITIQNGGTFDVTLANTEATDDWESRTHLHARVFTFPSPVTISAGSTVTISAEGSANPSQNIFFVGGVIVALPSSPPDYPGFVAGGSNATRLNSWVNGLNTQHAGTDILPNRYYIGSATYTSLPASSSLILGALNPSQSFGQNDIRQILVYDSVLDDTERFTVQRYLAAKHGIATRNHPIDHPLAQFNHIMGTQQIGRQYSFGESGGRRVLDAARAVYRQGASVYKISLSNSYAVQNGVPVNSEIQSLTDLVRDEPSIRAVFDMPFKDLLFWASSFSVPNIMARRTPSGLPLADQQLIYDEIYALTVHLLETYNGSGRRFYVGNWEGDWVLATLGSQDPETDITPARINTMVDWARVRQQAIDDAKTNTPHSDVEVWHYLEMNKGDWAIANRPCIVNSVMPALSKLDFVSYSAYDSKALNRADTHAVLDKIRGALPTIDSSLPDYLKPTGERLIIGEYGYFQGPNNRYTQTSEYVEEIKNFLTWGPPRFILMWEFFWEEDATNGLPKNMHMINSNNELHPLYHLHESYYQHMRQWVEDYVETHGNLPVSNAYRDEAVLKIGGFSPWPFTVKIDPASPTTLQIPGAVDAVLTELYSAQVDNGFGQSVSHEPVVWQLQPGNGATINSTTGLLSLPGNASPGDYTVNASLLSGNSTPGNKAVRFVLPTASIYDALTDFSKVSTLNPALQIVGDNAELRFEGDTSRIRRISSTAPQPITWNVAGLNRFHAKVYYFNDLNLSAQISPDGSSWQTIALRVDPPTVTSGSWRRSWVAPQAPLPAGTHYLRLVLQDPVHSYTPQIGEVAIFGDATGYEFWKQQNFPNSSDWSDPSISGPEATDSSGLSNLFRYLTEMGLSETDYTLIPQLRLAGDQVVYAIPFDATKSDVRVRVLASLDLQTWPYTIFDSLTDTPTTDDGWLIVDFDAIPEADAKFMRVVWDLEP